MIARILPRAVLSAACAAGLAACGESHDGDARAASPAAAGPVPSQAEFEAAATQAITPENADAEFERLKSEIDSDV